jgi:hypothetical protein
MTAVDPRTLFHTRAPSNEGVRLDLVTPNGERTDHWLKVLGADSDAFRDAELLAKRDSIRVGGIKDEAERLAETRRLQVRLLSAVVVAWSFEHPCTREAVEEFLTEAPQVADSIDTLISKRALFFGKRSIDSSGTPSKSSSST